MNSNGYLHKENHIKDFSSKKTGEVEEALVVLKCIE